MTTKGKVYLILLISFICLTNGLAAQSTMKVRIAKIVIDSAYLTEYRAALAEHAITAIKAEPGVLTLNAVYDKQQPTHITVFEVYASDSAYQAHIKTPHFLKYKASTLKMVKSLELTEAEPIALESKAGMKKE